MAKNDTQKKICWTLTDGKAGMRSQVVGLSEALGLTTVHKTCMRPKWLALFPVRLTQFVRCLLPESDALEAPWPDVLIASGRRSIPLALYVRRASKGKTFVVYTQDPRIDSLHFDQVIAMDHDKIEGENVQKVSMALHGVTQKKLAEASKKYEKQFELFQKPYCALMIGGSTHSYTMDDKAMDQLIEDLKKMLDSFTGTLLITPSRRTSLRHAGMLRESFKEHERVFVADLEKDNPYFGFLGLSDAFIVTDDSVNMMSECCATGKTVYVYNLVAHQNTKAKRFSQKLIAQKKAFMFAGNLKQQRSSYEDETKKMAVFLREKLIQDRGFSSEDFSEGL